nr:HalX domain-containing protein [Halomicroarcula limicola]
MAARRYDDRLAEYLELTSKLTLLEGEKQPQALEADERVDALQRRVNRLKAEMDDALVEFEDTGAAFEQTGRGSE